MLGFYSFDRTRQRLHLICTPLKVIVCYLNFQIETRKLSPPPPKASKKDRTQKIAPTDKISSMKVTVISSLSSKTARQL